MVCLSRILQCTVRGGGVHISALDGVLLGMGEVHCGMCETGLLKIICARKHNISVQYENGCKNGVHIWVWSYLFNFAYSFLYFESLYEFYYRYWWMTL